MRKIYTTGETVFDIIFKNNEPVAAKAGGSALNTSVSLGRFQFPVWFISEYGEDRVGTIIENFLHHNNVKTDFVYRFKNRKSVVALAFLDSSNNASYSFYKPDNPETETYQLPEIEEDDILLFGSFFSVEKDNRPIIEQLVKNAERVEALKLFDPNFRNPHFKQLPELKPAIMQNFEWADIIRGSIDDFELIFGTTDIDVIYEQLPKNHNTLLISTAAEKGVNVRLNDFRKHYIVPKIRTVSTIGAGDSFNAGIIYSLIQYGVTSENLHEIPPHHLDSIIKRAINFSTHVCMSYDNYISNEYAKEIMNSQSV